MADNYGYGVRTAERYGAKPFAGYASKDITVSGSVTDYSLKDNTTLFDHVSNPVIVTITNGSAAISVKFNETTNDSVNIAANAEKKFEYLTVSDIFVTATSASFKVFTLGWR
jgi:hypothetical protein